jgi:hypothetical protein
VRKNIVRSTVARVSVVPTKEKSFEIKRGMIQIRQIRRFKKEGYQIRRTPEGYEFYKTPEQVKRESILKKKKELKKFYKEEPLPGLGHFISTSFLSYEDPLGFVSTYYALRGEKEKVFETKAKASIDLDAALDAGVASYILKISTSPIASIGIAYGIAAGIGASVGALKAAYPTVGKMVEVGIGLEMGSYFARETHKIVTESISTGEYERLVGYGGMSAVQLGAGISGYRAGYHRGYGHMEAYLYGKHTFKPGSPEAIRFKEALKISRRLQDVRTHKLKPIDIAKDIMRMDRKMALRTIEFLRTHPRTTIGGSAASKAQIEYARVPRDLDLLIKGGKKEVAIVKKLLGKTKTAKGEHLIDIHGSEFYKPGKYHQFSFISKHPIKIGKYRYLRAGEQLFRKGIAATKRETTYRHFKDYPDFITHTRSLIKSAKMKIYTRWKGISAEKHLKIFLKPEKHPSYGRPETLLSSWVKSITAKPLQPQRVILPTGGKGLAQYFYHYPKQVYPYPTLGSLPSLYFVSKIPKTKYVLPSNMYKMGDYDFYPPLLKMPGYIPVTLPSKIYTPTKYEPPYKPPTFPPPKPSTYKPPYDPFKLPPPISSGKSMVEEEYLTLFKKMRINIKDISLGYREREWKMPKVESLLKIKM